MAERAKEGPPFFVSVWHMLLHPDLRQASVMATLQAIGFIWPH